MTDAITAWATALVTFAVIFAPILYLVGLGAGWVLRRIG